ncbi:MAG: ABC transporter ATP-binding protein/permease [Rickettsiales bacterium]|jgi:ABC-type protease/lipase transport system fused ATPase/permease subunit|nr:ABC transporter ATP-binding protein/permease [Rickettsiales bacterium]
MTSSSGRGDAYFGAGAFSAGEILAPFAGEVKKLFALSFVLSALDLSVPLALALIVDGAVGAGVAAAGTGAGFSGPPLASVLAFAALAGLAVALRSARAAGVGRVLGAIGARVDKVVFDRIFRLGIPESGGAEGFFRSVLADMDSLRNALSGSYVTGAMDAAFSMLFMAGAAALAGGAFFIPIAFAAACWAGVFAAGRALAKAGSACRAALWDRDALVSSAIRDMPSIRTMNIAEKLRGMLKDYQSALGAAGQERMAALDRALSVNSALLFGALGALAAACGPMAAEGAMGYGTLAAALVLVSMAFSSVRDLIKYLPECFRFADSMERLSRIVAARVDGARVKSVEEISDGLLKIRSASLEDFGGRTVLSGASFDFSPGRAYLVKAASSFAAARFLKALAGAEPLSSGHVMFDRYDVDELAVASLGAFVRYVPPAALVVDGTIKENLSLFASSRDASFESFIDYRKASAMLGFDKVAAGVPNGYGAVLSASDARLSPEDGKLLSLARAFVGNPRALLFDRPLSGLSEARKRAFLDAVSAEAADRIIIIYSEELLPIKHISLDISDGAIKASPPRDGSADADESAPRAVFRKLFKRK